MYHVAMDHEDELYELLKSADHEPGHIENDEDKSTVGTTSIHEEPEDRGEAGTVDAPWGEAGPTQNGYPQADHNSNGAWNEHKKDRQGVLDDAFSGRAKADKADQKLISQNFKRGKSGDFNSHSVHLQAKSVEKVSHPRTPTLMEQVLKVSGRI